MDNDGKPERVPEEEEEEEEEEVDKEEGGDDSPLILRHPRRHTGHVTFGHNDIRPISTNLERSRSAKKEKKERERDQMPGWYGWHYS